MQPVNGERKQAHRRIQTHRQGRLRYDVYIFSHSEITEYKKNEDRLLKRYTRPTDEGRKI